MKKENLKINDQDTMLPEYDFDYSKAVWGKHVKRLQEEGSNVVLLDADVYEVFNDSRTVNEALRSLIEISKLAQQRKLSKQSKVSKTVAENG